MRPRSVLEIELSSHGKESFGEAMQEIVAGADQTAATQVPGAVVDPAALAETKSLLFGRYRTERELGRGGMGIVWLARDIVLEIPVALKLVPEVIVHDSEGIVNLKKEVLRGMALAHPGIVRVHGFEQQEKTAGIVMEHVDGESLSEKKLRQPDRCFNVEEVRPWLEQLCVALDYAHHEARIAHRDLKPSNLLLTPTGRIKIVDFGLAATLGETLSRISVHLGVSGTPPYMSPQQLMGQRPTHLDDLYSLGATLYELLAGTPPFFRGDIVTQVMREAPQPLVARRAEFCVTSCTPIPLAWERAIAACLAKDPGARPPTAAAILEIIDGVRIPVSIPAPAGASRPVHDPAHTYLPKEGASRTLPGLNPPSPTDDRVDAAPNRPAPPEMVEAATEVHVLPASSPRPDLRLAPVPFAPPELRIIEPRPAPPSEPVQRVYPRPVPPRAPRSIITLQPVLGATAFLVRGVGVAIGGLADLVISVLRPLLKIAAVLAVLWGLLHLKQKWDAGAPQRQAAAGAAARSAAPAGAPVPQVIVLPPPPMPPPPPPPEFGPRGGRPQNPLAPPPPGPQRR